MTRGIVVLGIVLPIADRNTGAKLASGSVGDASLRAQDTVAVTTSVQVAPRGIVVLGIVPLIADRNSGAKLVSGSVGDSSLHARGTVAATTGAQVFSVQIEAQRPSPD